jgi:hypothetical protein
MIYRELKQAIELYTHVSSSEIAELTKQFVNESVLTFSRMYPWEKLKVSETISLNGSGSYVLDNSILRNVFGFEINLVSMELEKVNYEDYSKLDDKTGYWSILGDTLYVEGDDTDLTFIFISPGQYPKEHTIFNVDTGDKQFIIANDVRPYFKAGKKIFVSGSTGNDGTYTVISIGYDDISTFLNVSETIPSAVVDGTVRSSFQYPFIGNDYDEINATVYYWDVIKQMVICNIMDYLGDETIQKEELNLQRKLSLLKSNENRANNLGKLNIVLRK